MTKTEQKLLDRIDSTGGRTGVEWGYTWGTTGQGHGQQFGERERKAAESLIKKGLCKELNRHQSSGTRQGWRTHSVTSIMLVRA